MNDNDIIKALECCVISNGCPDCLMLGERNCMRKKDAYSICLINRQRAEIERLKNENAKLRHEMSYMKKPDTIGDIHEMGAW